MYDGEKCAKGGIASFMIGLLINVGVYILSSFGIIVTEKDIINIGIVLLLSISYFLTIITIFAFLRAFTCSLIGWCVQVFIAFLILLNSRGTPMGSWMVEFLISNIIVLAIALIITIWQERQEL